MIGSLSCGICTEGFDSKILAPRVCQKCGNSICSRCLDDILKKCGLYACPFCKYESKDPWARNLPIINLLEEQKDTLLCTPHKRKAVSLCCSKNCNIPIAMCDSSECSKLHREMGTNCLPVSLLLEPTSNISLQQNQRHLNKLLMLFYSTLKSSLPALLDSLAKTYLSHESRHASQSVTQSTMEKLRKRQLDGVTSEQMMLVKAELIEGHGEEEKTMKAVWEAVARGEKERVMDAVRAALEAGVVQYEGSFGEDEVRKSKVQTAMKIQLPPEFEIIREHLESVFTPVLIFDSKTQQRGLFKARIAGQENLVFVVQLKDKNVFGVYFKRAYPKDFFNQKQFIDRDAFFFWANQHKIYKAAKDSISQFDVSPDYLLSIGNTYNWDGMWLQSDFETLNPLDSRLKIRSSQYDKLDIPLTTKQIENVKVYQLDMI